jgi:5-methylcytosine-specific restriction protein A
MPKADWHHLYDTKRWKARRLFQLGEHPLCAMCMQAGKIAAATVADHIVPHKGNEELFYEGELQSLCVTCHNAGKQRQEHRGLAQGCDASGNPLDSSHHWN